MAPTSKTPSVSLHPKSASQGAESNRTEASEPASPSVYVVGKVLAEEDAELADQDLSDPHNEMSYRPPSQPSSGVKIGAVANGIASCAALSFFSISMILANKVRSG